MSLLPERPKIPERFSVIPVQQDEFYLYSLTGSLSIKSEARDLLPRLLPLLNGRHQISEVLRELKAFGEDHVMSTLELLLKAGVLEDAEPPQGISLSPAEMERYRSQLVFLSHFAVAESIRDNIPWPDVPSHAIQYQERLKQARIVVLGLGRLGSQLVRLLALAGVGRIVGVDDGYVGQAELDSDAWFDSRQMGLTRCDALQELVSSVNSWVEFRPLLQPIQPLPEIANILSDSTFAILSTDYFNPEQYDAFNRACLQTSTQWTSCRLSGFEFSIGPTVIPYKTPCYKCFDLRQKSNLTDYEDYLLLEGYLKTSRLHSGMLAMTPGIGLAALEVIKGVTQFMEPATYSHVFSLNLLNMECRRHPILKIPRCPHCGRPSQSRPTIQMWQQSREED